MRTKFLIKLICAIWLTGLICVSDIYSQVNVAIQVIDANGSPVTGLTSSEIKFRKSPYGSGDEIPNISVTEVGSQGNYVCWYFSTFQLTRLFINGVQQNWFGEQFTGDPGNLFYKLDGSNDNNRWVHTTGNEQIFGQKSFMNLTSFLGGFNNYTYDASMGNKKIKNLADPVDNTDAANKQWVLDQINTIQIIPYQESPNIVRLIVGGTQETGKVYTSWPMAMWYCKQFAGDTRRYTIEIKGTGTTTTHIEINSGGISGLVPFENYISIKGENQNIFLDAVDGNSYLVTLGKVIVENVTIFCNTESAALSFNGFIFKDCVFDMTSIEQLEIINSAFRGDNVFKIEGTLKLTNCRGNKVRCKYTPVVSGTYQIDYHVDPNIY